MSELVIIQEGAEGRVIPIDWESLENERFTLGRLKSNDLPIEDTKASRQHARIFLGDGETILVDLDSQNGTLVNGRSVTRHSLRDGDRITIGATELLFREGRTGSSAPASPIPRADVTPGPETPRPADFSPDDIQLADAPLQFSKYKDDRSRSILKEDLAQSGGAFRWVVVTIGIVAMVGVAIGAAWFTLSIMR